MKVTITEQAFISLLAASIEVFPKESLGVLLGHQAGDSFLIESVIACQKAHRHSSWVEVLVKPMARLKKLFANFSQYGVIGDFHSHTKNDVSMSESDLESMVPGEIYIVALIKKSTKEKPWSCNEDGTISGTIDAWYIKIASYYIEEESLKLRKAEVVCTFAIGFGIRQ